MGENKQQPPKESWGGKLEFLLSCIGYCVGLGNVWRFPYLAYENGGGVFFIPYFLMLFLCGIPIFLTELSLGQFSGEGTLGVWKTVPAFKGIGYGMIAVSFFVMIYYNIVIAYSLHYLVAGFNKVLPWTECNAWWNKNVTRAYCEISTMLTPEMNNCRNNETFWKLNGTFTDEVMPGITETYGLSDMQVNDLLNVSLKSSEPAEEYWFRRVLQLYNDETDANPDTKFTLDNLGVPLGELIGANFVAWLLVFACLYKGVQSVGKVVYVTATFPYVVLVILVIFGATLDGAKDGIRFYLKPDVSKLGDSKVWAAAATQIFYSLGVTFGGLMVMSSYNKFDNNILRDTFIVSCGNCFSSVFAGFGVFSFLGHMAYKNCIKVEDVVASGPGLAFIAYPEAMSLLPASQFFSALFFIMLVTLGLDSQFAMVDVLIAGFLDEFPSFRYGWKRTVVLTSVCLIGFLLGIPILTNGGYWFFNLINDYSAYHGLLILALCLIVVQHFVYNFKTTKFRFVSDLEEMVGSISIITKGYFYSMWYLITPVMLLYVIITAFSSYDTIANGYRGVTGDAADSPIQVFPEWSNTIAMLMSMTPAVIIVVYFVVSILLKGLSSLNPADDFMSQKEKEEHGTGNPAFREIAPAQELQSDL